jgi:hypothetical protein
VSDDQAQPLRPLSEGEHALADIVAVVEQVYHHLYGRDRSNAALHMQPVIERPLTEAVDRLLHGTVQTVWDELKELRRQTAPAPEGQHLVTVHLSEDTVQRLCALAAASGAGTMYQMAETVLENYAQTLSTSYCFEHCMDGCGDAHGKHLDTPASALYAVTS